MNTTIRDFLTNQLIGKKIIIENSDPEIILRAWFIETLFQGEPYIEIITASRSKIIEFHEQIEILD